MNPFHDFKSEIRLLLIVAAISAVLAIAGIFLLQDGLKPFSPTPAPVAQTPSYAPSPSPQPQERPPIATSRWQTYEGAYPVSFLYPEDLRLSEGDTGSGSIIRIWSPLRGDGDTEFQVLIQYRSSFAEVMQNLEEKGFEKGRTLDINGFSATELRGTATPNTSVPARTVTTVVVQVGEQVYGITNWRPEENEEVFTKILATVRFVE